MKEGEGDERMRRRRGSKHVINHVLKLCESDCLEFDVCCDIFSAPCIRIARRLVFPPANSSVPCSHDRVRCTFHLLQTGPICV